MAATSQEELDVHGTSSLTTEMEETTNDLPKKKENNGKLYDDLIVEYEAMFKNRYTDEDESYVDSIKKPISVPPLIHPWYNKPRRNFDYANSNRRQGGGDHFHQHRGRWSGNRSHNYQGRNQGGNNNYFRDQRQRSNRGDRHQPY